MWRCIVLPICCFPYNKNLFDCYHIYLERGVKSPLFSTSLNTQSGVWKGRRKKLHAKDTLIYPSGAYTAASFSVSISSTLFKTRGRDRRLHRPQGYNVYYIEKMMRFFQLGEGYYRCKEAVGFSDCFYAVVRIERKRVSIEIG